MCRGCWRIFWSAMQIAEKSQVHLESVVFGSGCLENLASPGKVGEFKKC
jgi:hypothetical protein